MNLRSNGGPINITKYMFSDSNVKLTQIDAKEDYNPGHIVTDIKFLKESNDGKNISLVV